MDEELLNTLIKVHKYPASPQRKLAEGLGFSLGKLNYFLKALKDKGLIKINNFKKNKNKSKYIYILTAKGITEKTKLTIRFMRKKSQEYDDLEKELNKNNDKKNYK